MVILSFILPLYNLEEYILPCLTSIVESPIDISTYEVLVWNDGSSDNGPEIVENYSKSHPQVRIINEENKGVSFSRNAALKEAAGQYVWFVDSDDLLQTDNIQSLINIIVKLQSDVLLFNWQSLSPNGAIEEGLNKISKMSIQTGRELYLSSSLNMAPWSFIYKKDFLLSYGIQYPTDYKTCEDIQFNQKALFHARKVVASPIVGYIYRHRHSSATKGQGYRVANDHIRRLKDELAYFSEYKDWRFLSEVIYRNLREINVWLFWTDRREELFIKLRETLRNLQYKKRPLFSIQTGYFYLMKYSPKLVFEIQLQLNIIKRKLKGQYVKQ